MNRPSPSTSSDSGQGENSAFAAAVRFLSRRDHSELELRSKLLSRGFSETAIERAVEKLYRLSYLDDHRAAMRFAETAMSTGRGFGPRLRYDLMRRGFSTDTINEVLSSVASQFDETTAIRNIVARKFSNLSLSISQQSECRRIIQYLQRRGFSLSAIFNVLGSVE